MDLFKKGRKEVEKSKSYIWNLIKKKIDTLHFNVDSMCSKVFGRNLLEYNIIIIFILLSL